MTRYIPLALALTACDGADIKTQQLHVPEQTAPDNWQLPKPDTETIAALGPLFPQSTQPDHNTQVRPLSRGETVVFQEKLELASFLAPYAAQLSAAGKMQNHYAKQGASQAYAQLIKQARDALTEGLVVVEPALNGSGFDGRYHSSEVTITYSDAAGNPIDEHTNRYIAYAFPDNNATWQASAILHEMAHHIYPLKHSQGMRWGSLAELGQHVVSTDDLVYDISQSIAIVEAPIAAVCGKINDARSGLKPHNQIFEELAWMNPPSDAAWSQTWLNGVFDLYQPYMDQIGWTRENIERIYLDPEYITGMRRWLSEAIQEYEAEMALSPERLAELQRSYGITANSLELTGLGQPENIAIIVGDWKQPGETWTDVNERLDQKIIEAQQRHEAERTDQNMRIDEVNAAIRRTRHAWSR